MKGFSESWWVDFDLFRIVKEKTLLQMSEDDIEGHLVAWFVKMYMLGRIQE